MADHTESDDRSRRVASGFPDPADVPGPTERLRELHGDIATQPKPPKYGRASASTAGSDDYVSLDDMERGSATDAPADRVAGFARRVAEETATRLRADFDRRGIAGKAKAAGVGVGALGLGVLGATGTAMIAGLSRVMPVWAAALVTAGAFGVPAAILSSRGLKRINGIGLGESATAS
jgi:hypothetical protein